MSAISLQRTVGELVREKPARSRVFEQFRIDYCCGGKTPLADACKSSGALVEEVLRQLAEADARQATGAERAVDADAMGLTELADHIEATHHAYLREELPRLDRITEKVARVHSDKDPRLTVLREAFVALRDELASHMLKEERILFPICREIENARGVVQFHCGSIANPIHQMEAEHDNAGNALAIMHEATDGYRAPEWACNTYRAMLDALAQLEQDMHQHIHKENNVLFPKALAREQALTGGKETL